MPQNIHVDQELQAKFARLKRQIDQITQQTACAECAVPRYYVSDIEQWEAVARTLMNHFPGGLVFLFDHDLRYLEASGLAMARNGVSRDTLVGHTIWEALPPEVCTIIEPAYRAALAGQEHTFQMPFANGMYAVHVLPIYGMQEQVIAGMAITHDITAHIEMEDSLRQSQTLLQSILDYSPAAIYVKNLQGRYLLVNRYMAAIAQCPLDEMINGYDTDIAAPEIVATWREHEQEVLKTGRPVEHEVLIPGKDGTYTYLEIKFPIYNVQGSISAIGGIATNVSERKRAGDELRNAHAKLEQRILARTQQLERSNRALHSEIARHTYMGQALREREASHRALLNAIPDMLFMLHRDGTFLDYRGSSEYSYLPTEDFLGKHVREVLPLGLAQQIGTAIDATMQGQGMQMLEYSLPRDEQPAFYEARIVASSPDTVLALIRDITAYKQAKDRLRQMQQFTRATLDSLSAHIAVLDDQGTILTVNRAWEAFTQENPPVTTNVCEGANYLSVCDNAVGYYAEEAAAFAAGIRAVLSGNKARVALEYPCHSPDEQRWFVGSITGFMHDQQRYAVVSHENVTDRHMAEEALREREGLYRALVYYATDMVTICDREGIVRYASPSVERILGYTVNEMVGQSSFAFLHPDDYHRVQASFAAKSTSMEPRAYEPVIMRLRNRQGDWRWLEATSTNLLADSAIQGVVVNARDITERKEAEDRLRESEERFRQVVEHLDVVFWLSTPDHRTILYVSPNYETMYGNSCASLYADPTSFYSLVHPDDLDRVKQYQASTPDMVDEIEYRVVLADGSVRWVWVHSSPVRNEETGEIVRRVGVMRDITASKAHAAQIEYMAFTDHLTGLPNRNRLYQTGKSALQAAQERQESIALLYLDIDRFKTVNDALGHDAGDELLVEISHRLLECVQNGNMLVRLGGDEFGVLLTHASAERAVAVATHILDLLRQPIDLFGQIIHLQGSIGVTVSTPEDTRFSSLITRADIAMYRAKEIGGGVQVYDPAFAVIQPDQLQLEAELRAALEADDLTLHYQPIVNAQDGCLVWQEALVRWEHPTRGVLFPDTLLPLAEAAGLLASLDRWVLRQAFMQSAAWRARNQPDMVTINLTAWSLQNPNLVGEIAHMLQETGAIPTHIMIEVTEHSALRDMETTQTVLANLRQLGLRVALDDFGKGYASLTYLRQLPVDVLKLDKEFAAGIGSDAGDEAIMRAMVTMAHGLNLVVVVEGVEESGQLAWLRDTGDLLAQGYLLGRPVPAEQ